MYSRYCVHTYTTRRYSTRVEIRLLKWDLNECASSFLARFLIVTCIVPSGSNIPWMLLAAFLSFYSREPESAYNNLSKKRKDERISLNWKKKNSNAAKKWEKWKTLLSHKIKRKQIYPSSKITFYEWLLRAYDHFFGVNDIFTRGFLSQWHRIIGSTFNF